MSTSSCNGEACCTTDECITPTSTSATTTTTVTAWKVEGSVTNNDIYDRLIKDFGCESIDLQLLMRFEKVTGHKPHKWLRRGLFFAHRGLKEILDDFEKKVPIFLYTGRGPTSESLHIGHIIAMEFTQWLQKVFNAIVVFQVADDEKYYFKDNLTFEQIEQFGKENMKDVAAMGYDPKKTFIFSNRQMMRDESYQRVGADFKKHTTIKMVNAIFGIDETCSIGQAEWPIWQSVAAFSEAFSFFKGQKPRCLVAYAIDQDPYFRLARDVAAKLKFHKPCAIMCRFLPALEGDSKMSSTAQTGPPKTIFLTSTPKEIKDMITKHAFSGGGDSLENHRKNGGNPDIDVPYQWLRHFMEDDVELEYLYKGYKAGTITTGEMKKRCIEVVTEMVEEHKQRRAQVTDEMMREFYTAPVC